MVTKADISLIRSLADKKARTEHNLFVVEGPKLVGEALASGFMVKRVIGLAGYEDFGPYEQVGLRELDRMSGLKTHQGILAVIEIPRREGVPDPSHGLMIALDGIQDPGNLGTIMRIADWFGISAVVCSGNTADCYNPKAVQASMGAIFRVQTVYVPDLAAVLTGHALRGSTVYGAFLEGENIWSADLGDTRTGIIVMGNEGNGISPECARTINHKLFIPPYPAGEPAAESLNVAAATAIICSEFRRRSLK